MPSWEQIVERVTIQSNFYNLADSAQAYQRAFNDIDEVRHSLRDLKNNSESWRGAAADGFREHIQSIIDGLEDLVERHRKIKDGLQACSTALSTAVAAIPIPSWMINDVYDRQRAYQFQGSFMGFQTNEFLDRGASWVADQVVGLPFGIGDAVQWLAGWIDDREQNANEAYQKLLDDYNQEYPNIPEGEPFTPNPISDRPQVNPIVPPPPPPPTMPTDLTDEPPRIPSTVDPPGLDGPGNLDRSGTTTPRLPDSNAPSFPGSGFDPDALPSTGLAGAGGLSGAGSGLGGGLGGLGGLGAGAGLGAAGGLGAGGGLGGKLPPIGPAVAPNIGSLMGAGAGAGRGAAGAGRGGGRGGAGRGAGRLAAMGGHGAGRGEGDGDEHSTWLKEDEDVWGGDDAPPSGVLGA